MKTAHVGSVDIVLLDISRMVYFLEKITILRDDKGEAIN